MSEIRNRITYEILYEFSCRSHLRYFQDLNYNLIWDLISYFHAGEFHFQVQDVYSSKCMKFQMFSRYFTDEIKNFPDDFSVIIWLNPAQICKNLQTFTNKKSDLG